MAIFIIFTLLLSICLFLGFTTKKQKHPTKTDIELEIDLKLNELLQNMNKHNSLVQTSLDNVDYLNQGLFLISTWIEK